MYDYLAKIILIGPSGSGKCVCRRLSPPSWLSTNTIAVQILPPASICQERMYVHSSDPATRPSSCPATGRVLSSQTIGVEFASKILRLGTPPNHTRIKLQLWDTAGTERFRSVSRSYYRGAAGALLVYDVTNRASFNAVQTFLRDARALAGDGLVVALVGNKLDAAEEGAVAAASGMANSTAPDSRKPAPQPEPPDLLSDEADPADADAAPSPPPTASTINSSAGFGARQTSTVAPHGRAVAPAEAARWASTCQIPVSVEVSALDGSGVGEVFAKLARTILTKIELGEIDPDDPASGIQYGDAGVWGEDGGSVRSGRSGHSTEGMRRRKGKKGAMNSLREWEDVFRLDGGRRRRRGCC